MTTPIETMMEIIAQANDSREGTIWEQGDLWQETLDLISEKSVSDFSEIDTLLVTGTFDDMLRAMKITDTGFASYEQMMGVFLER
jgi:hypothetical protein